MPGTIWGGGLPSSCLIAQSFPGITAASLQILAANANRKFLSLQNNSPTKNLRIGFDAAASLVSFMIPPFITWAPNAVPTNAINAMGELGGAGANFLANECVVLEGN